jgi:DNA-binding CsgD family transcriptional regulator
MSRRRQLDLTEQQRRVIELMSRGRTNYDIAQELEVTLDGAKYHIRQVFDKLGVDSREEAVAAWKASRGGVFERVRGWLWPVGAAAVGGAAIVTAVVVGAVALSGGFGTTSSAGEGGSSVPAGVWVAVIQPADPSQQQESGTLKVFDAANPADAHVFAGSWSMGVPNSIFWSPTGGSLAVKGQTAPDQPFSLVVFDRSTGSWKSASFRTLQPGIPFSWSPDGDYLAFADLTPGAIRVRVVSHTGEDVAHLDLPPLKQAAQLDLNPLWSPSGDTAAWVIQGKLVVVSQEGGHVYDPPEGTDPSFLKLTGWGDDKTVGVTIGGPAYAVRLNGGKATWTQVTDAMPSPTDVSPADMTPSQMVRQAWATATAAQLRGAGMTADGKGEIFESAFNFATTDRSRPTDQHAVVEHDGHATVVDLGQRIPQPDLLGDWYDIVITK